jgi:hypothetical protein
VVFSAADNAAGSASFTYTVDDGFGGQSTAEVDLSIIAGTGTVGPSVSAAINSPHVLIGSAGNDQLFARNGIDVLKGAGGYDTYNLTSSFGHAQVNNFADNGVTSAQGEVDFGSGISAQQLWFGKNEDNLEVDVLGTSDQLTITGWYSEGARAQVAAFNLADGSRLDSQVSQLISAMAAYTVRNPTFDPTSASQMPADSNLQGAIGAAWHGGP